MKWPDSSTATQSLKFALWNVENLFVLFDQKPNGDLSKLEEPQWQKLSNSIYENKPLKKVLELQKIIREMSPDILMLCEVGGPESLANFNQHFLNNEYATALVEGNSDRNIDVGFLVRRSLPFYFDLQSNKNRPINFFYPQAALQEKSPVSLKFSRDVVELKLFKANRDQPFLILLLGHLKSHLDPEKVDPGGFTRRQAELKTLLKIHQELLKAHPQTPQIVAGDFNGNASRHNTDEEFKPLYQQTQLEDVLQVAQIKPENRWTFCQVKPGGGRTDGKQLDYAFITPALKDKVKPSATGVYRFKDEYGFEKDWPMTLDAKLELPSDHYPLFFELDKLPIW
ncbi:MAG: endonuclease/exonuclease/phosphatase family protein [Bdellovibrionales bacterium]